MIPVINAKGLEVSTGCFTDRLGSKFIGYPGRIYQQGDGDYFFEKKIGGEVIYFENRGRRRFLLHEKF